VQECPQPPPGPTSHAGRARTGAPTGHSRSLAIGRAVRRSRPDQCVDHRPCLPVFFSWLHFRQPRRQQPHVAAHSSNHRIGSGLRPRDRRPFVGARHPLRPHFARSSSAGHRWSAARDTSWLTPDHQQWSPHNAQICAAGAERGIDAATAPNGGSSCVCQRTADHAPRSTRAGTQTRQAQQVTARTVPGPRSTPPGLHDACGSMYLKAADDGGQWNA
jgi:hypothetical protein